METRQRFFPSGYAVLKDSSAAQEIEERAGDIGEQADRIKRARNHFLYQMEHAPRRAPPDARHNLAADLQPVHLSCRRLAVGTRVGQRVAAGLQEQLQRPIARGFQTIDEFLRDIRPPICSRELLEIVKYRAAQIGRRALKLDRSDG